mgnify:CR=1 FL=1
MSGLMAVLHPMRLLAPVLALCLLASPVHASRKPAAATAASAPVPLLWEVRGAGDSRVLLLGSFHLLQDSDYPLAEDVQQAYAQADRLVFELSPEEMTSPALAGAMLAAARMAGLTFPSLPGGVTITIWGHPAIFAGMVSISTVEG